MDYVDKEAIINGVSYDKGQIACDILNIPEKVLCGLYELNNDFLPLFYQMVYSGSENTISAEAIQKSARQALHVADTLSKYKPFSYFGKEGFIKDYSMLSENSTDISNNWSTVFGPSSQIFISIASAFNIASSLIEFRDMIMPIIKETDSDDYERTVIGYARVFDKYFKEAKASNGKWLPFAVVYQESIVKNGIFGKKLEFMQFSEMIASDFVEGLTVGHAPKKCRMCGRYFLTTNAHHPHYCNEVNPDDEDGDSDPIDIFEAIPDLAPDRWLHDEYIGNIPAEDIYNAFMKLSYKEQRMIEKRLAICMQCKRVSDPAFKTSFEDMAIDFELKSPRAAEKIYRNALDEITKILIEKSDFDGVKITLESRNGYGIRTKSAVYKFRPYCPKNEFEWGTIEFDFTTGKTKVDKPFLFDAYETEVEKYIKSIPVSNLSKEAIVPFV